MAYPNDKLCLLLWPRKENYRLSKKKKGSLTRLESIHMAITPRERTEDNKTLTLSLANGGLLQSGSHFTITKDRLFFTSFTTIAIKPVL